MLSISRRSLRSRSVLLCGLLTLSGPVLAERGWSGEAAFGALDSSGNSESRSINAKLSLIYRSESWTNEFNASAINAGDEDETTTELYNANDQLDYNFSERSFMFGRGEFEKDLVGGTRQRTSETVGYGRHLLLGPTHFLDATLGIGARQTEEQDTGNKENEFIQRGAVRYRWVVSKTATFATGISVEAGPKNIFSESITELKLSIIGNLAAALSYTLRNNTDVPADTNKTDTYTAINLTYGFGKS